MGDGYDIVVCINCGAGFADGIPSQNEMDRYYSERSPYSYDHSDGAESPWDMRRFEATVDQLVPYLASREVRILDIGCATGGLLSVFKKRGYGNVMGVDPSHACSEAAARLHGVTVRTGTLAHLRDWNEGFDLILMVGVLEHLGDVKAPVRTVSRLLNRGGRLYVAVPDVEGLSTCPNAPFQQFSVEHVNFLSSSSLRRLMAECGMAESSAWNWTIEWREGVWEPIASGLYETGNPPCRLFDATTEPALERYLAFSEHGDREILAAIGPLLASAEPIIVWGAGTLARRLLVNTRLAQANIVAFVDSNRHLHGKSLAGRPIWSPAELAIRKETILICSMTFVAEIADAIRHQYHLTNRVVSLSGTDPNPS
jgi:SAM-dependent methyltransferase